MLVAILALLLVLVLGFGLVASLLLGLLAFSSPGVVIALTGRAVAPERRAFGMGVFQMGYFLLVAPCPVVAGWLFDVTGSVRAPVVFAMAGFGVTALAYALFLFIESRLPAPSPGASA